MNNYYFTFGQGHLIDGLFRMTDYWVRVIAPDKNTATTIFVDLFAKPIMGGAHLWSMVYSEQKFDKSWWPKGEFLVLKKYE